MTPLEYEYSRQLIRDQVIEQMAKAAMVFALQTMSDGPRPEGQMYDPLGHKILRSAEKEITL